MQILFLNIIYFNDSSTFFILNRTLCPIQLGWFFNNIDYKLWIKVVIWIIFNYKHPQIILLILFSYSEFAIENRIDFYVVNLLYNWCEL